jgi:hypothetical protein
MNHATAFEVTIHGWRYFGMKLTNIADIDWTS